MREEQRPPEDGVIELAPNVRRIQLPMSMPGLGHVNCYILDDERGAALVDPGLPGPNNWKALMKGLEQAEVPPERIHSIVITHSHPDHFGAAGHFHDKYGCEIITHKNFRMWWNLEEEDDEPLHNVVSPGDNARLRDDPLFAELETGPRGPTPWGGERYKMPWHRRLGYAMMRKGWGGAWFSTPKPTRRIEDADRISLARREFVAVHTPGHTADHLCLYLSLIHI